MGNLKQGYCQPERFSIGWHQEVKTSQQVSNRTQQVFKSTVFYSIPTLLFLHLQMVLLWVVSKRPSGKKAGIKQSQNWVILVKDSKKECVFRSFAVKFPVQMLSQKLLPVVTDATFLQVKYRKRYYCFRAAFHLSPNHFFHFLRCHHSV